MTAANNPDSGSNTELTTNLISSSTCSISITTQAKSQSQSQPQIQAKSQAQDDKDKDKMNTIYTNNRENSKRNQSLHINTNHGPGVQGGGLHNTQNQAASAQSLGNSLFLASEKLQSSNHNHNHNHNHPAYEHEHEPSQAIHRQQHQQQQQQNLNHAVNSHTSSNRSKLAGRSKNSELPLYDNQNSFTTIMIAFLPSVLSSITGISLKEYILLALIFFYLYWILKVPGDLLIETRKRSQENISAGFWRSRESQILALYTLAPIFAGLGLYYTKVFFPDMGLLKHVSVGVFFLAAFLKPFFYLSGIVKESFLIEPRVAAKEPPTIAEFNELRIFMVELKKRVKTLESGLEEKISEIVRETTEPLKTQIHLLKKERVKVSAQYSKLQQGIQEQSVFFHEQMQKCRLMGGVDQGNGDRKLLECDDRGIAKKYVNQGITPDTQAALDSLSIQVTNLGYSNATLADQLCQLDFRIDSMPHLMDEWQHQIEVGVRDQLHNLQSRFEYAYSSSVTDPYSTSKSNSAAASAHESVSWVLGSALEYSVIKVLESPVFLYFWLVGGFSKFEKESTTISRPLGGHHRSDEGDRDSGHGEQGILLTAES